MKSIFIRIKSGLALTAMVLLGAGTGAWAQNADNCVDALPAAEGLNTFVTLTGTGNSVVCSTGGTSAAWYTYTPAANGQLDIYACGAVDTRVSVYSGDCTTLACVGTNDDANLAFPCQTGNFAAGLSLNVIGGVTYYIEWDNRWSSTGADWNLNFFSGIPGCTNPAAVNFDANATADDGSCVVPPCTDAPLNNTLCYGNGESVSFYFEPTTAGDQVVAFFNAGTVESATFDQLVIYDGSDATAPILYANPIGITTQLAGLIIESTLGNGIFITLNTDGSVSCATTGTYIPWDFNVFCAVLQVPGCTDPAAPNFDPAATFDDGSCLPPCLDNEVSIDLADSFGDGWNGATYSIIDLATASVVASGTLATGSAQTDFYCLPDGCYTLSVTGGTFPGEVSWTLSGADAGVLTGGALAVVDFTLNTAAGDCALIGCTDPGATNYDPTAVIDNGACVNCGGDLLLEISMTDAGNGGWGGATYSIVNVNNGTTVASGSLNNADTGNPLNNGTDFVCIPEGCYVFNVIGGINSANIGWEINDVIGNFYGSNTGNVSNFPLAIALGNPACAFQGCTNPVALNFEPSASIDDGSCILPPANDQACNAEAVTCGLSVSGTTINATDAEGLIGSDCAGNPVTSPGVWYEFNSASDQFVTVSTCGTVGAGDTRIHIYEGSCTNLTCVASNDDGCPTGFFSNIGFNAVTGGNYFIYVSEFGVGTGINFQLDIDCITCPSGAPTNDDCVAAFPQVSGLAVTGSTCCNAPSGAPNFIAGFGSAYDQWYVFNSANFDTFFFELNNIDGDAVGLMIYDGDCNTLVDVAGCFVAGTCAGSIEDFLPLQPNTDYYFAVFALDPAGCGEFTFETVGINLGCTDPVASNFDPTANQDNGTCEYIGVTPPNDECADAIALNCGDSITGSTGGASEFAVGCPTATVPAVCAVVPPAGVDTNLQCYTDVVTADPFCCNTAWDGLCQATYDTCVSACAATAVVWYTIEGNDEIINISSCGSVIAATVNIGTSTGGCAGPFTDVTLLAESQPCDFFNADDSNPSFLSVTGNTYYVQVSSQEQGSFVLDVTCTPAVFGCTNPVAYNFNPAANIDDQSCDFFSGTCTAGGTPVLFNMNDSFGDGWNGANYEITDGLGTVVASGTLDTADFFVDEDNFVGPEFGFDFVCLQDGCYTITVAGGTFPGEVSWNIQDENGNILAGGAPGTFDLVIGANTVCGCTNTGACNFDPAATSEDGSCEFDSCAGCTDPTACNFDATALIDNGSCCFDNCVTTDLIPVAGTGLFEVYSIDGTLVASVTPSACATCAVVPPAGVDTNTACYQDVVANDPFCCNTAWDAFCQATYDACAAGSPDVCSAADPVLCLADGCYYVVASGVSWTLFGVNGGFVSGGDAEAEDFVSFSVGSITCQIGCTEPLACNFDPAANVPDCTLCEFNSCLGCTYMDATNFDPNAGIDDGSCVFDLSSDCPADLNADGLINASDLSLFLQSFGTFCPN